MTRLSRALNPRKRDVKPDAAPLEVRVTAGGAGRPQDAAGVWIAGTPVPVAPGQEAQDAVLAHLHRLARAGGRPVLATIHDERIGYVVPLRVDPDGSSHLTSEPVRSGAAGAEGQPPATATGPAHAPEAEPPADRRTQMLRLAPQPPDAAESAPAHDVRKPRNNSALPPSPEARRRAPRWAAPEAQTAAPAPGAVAAPLGVFGPPPEMPPATARPTAPITDGPQAPGPAAGPYAAEPTRPAPDAVPAATAGAKATTTADTTTSTTAPAAKTGTSTGTGTGTDAEAKAARVASAAAAMAAAVAAESAAAAESRLTPTPARGFDAIAEAVLEDAPIAQGGDTSALPAGKVARVNEAVRAGRTELAAELAEETAAEAEATLGPEHPEVLGLRELIAYIAYLAGEPERAVRLSLDLARAHRRRRDAEAAYGTVRSAYTAWRAVRDPREGLRLGGELTELWSALAAEGGPAAADAERLRSVHARMDRLTARAAADAG
ncbi:tetratricopeptide repeat protein [Streptomyces sp. NPDC058733]|uniref:tetratricopeptide repeat protein n=1 Tax=unclassified Streptomyces TaxID=2593676 RepID=UPI003452B919